MADWCAQDFPKTERESAKSVLERPEQFTAAARALQAALWQKYDCKLADTQER
jgi:hypothetical protein